MRTNPSFKTGKGNSLNKKPSSQNKKAINQTWNEKTFKPADRISGKPINLTFNRNNHLNPDYDHVN